MASFSKKLTITAIFCAGIMAGCSEGRDSSAELNITEDSEGSVAELNITEDSQGTVADTEVAVFSSLDEHDMYHATDSVAKLK